MGWEAGNFWSKAQNVGNTFTLVKTTNDSKFGGYRNIPFIETNIFNY